MNLWKRIDLDFVVIGFFILLILSAFIVGYYSSPNSWSTGTCYTDSKDYGQPIADYKQIILKGRDGISTVRWDDRMQKWESFINTVTWVSLKGARKVKCPNE